MQLDPRSSDSSSSDTKSQGSDASLAAPESLAASGEDGYSRDASISAALTAQGDSLKPPESAPSHAPTAEADRGAYPVLLRAKRLSFCMPAALHGKFDGAEGAQVRPRIISGTLQALFITGTLLLHTDCLVLSMTLSTALHRLSV
jgi:hypothetical protein